MNDLKNFIISNNIYYLLHATDADYTKFTHLKPSGSSIDELKDQFPGVYFSLITKENIDTELLSLGDTFLLFSVDLLLQNNYHINIRDMNGIINEHNTYFSWELDGAVKHIINDIEHKKCIQKANLAMQNRDPKRLQKVKPLYNERTMNEIVFHDPVDMKYLCKVIDRNIYPPSYSLPRVQLRNYVEPDFNVKPFYCYYNEFQYTGIFPPLRSSKEWLNMMDLVSGKSINDDEYYDYIKYLYENRDEQHMEYLYNWKRLTN